jgi:hypothetical protein
MIMALASLYSDWVYFILALFVDEIAAYNFMIILSFALTAFFTYVFPSRLLQNNFTTFLGGLFSVSVRARSCRHRVGIQRLL